MLSLLMSTDVTNDSGVIRLLSLWHAKEQALFSKVKTINAVQKWKKDGSKAIQQQNYPRFSSTEFQFKDQTSTLRTATSPSSGRPEMRDKGTDWLESSSTEKGWIEVSSVRWQQRKAIASCAALTGAQLLDWEKGLSPSAPQTQSYCAASIPGLWKVQLDKSVLLKRVVVSKLADCI